MKTYWQVADKDGTEKTFWHNKPKLECGIYTDGIGDWCEHSIFPIKLKPLQIAEITVNENGTWSYEIEREEGRYCARWKHDSQFTTLLYENGKWKWSSKHGVHESDILKLAISSTRIPDECII